jgi:hypothetical protein
MRSFLKSEDGPTARSRSSVQKRVRSVFWCVTGGLAMAVCVARYLEARSDNPSVHNVSAADLLQIDKPESLPGWISYSPPLSFDTGVEYAKITRRQLTSKFLLLPVGNHWLLTEVAGHFTGLRFEGKLGSFDNNALRQVVTADPVVAERLLPYQLDARIDIAGTQHQSFAYAGAAGIVGLLMCVIGVRGFFTTRSQLKPLPSSVAVDSRLVKLKAALSRAVILRPTIPLIEPSDPMSS